MTSDFTHTVLGKTGFPVHRLGLSATYRPGKKTIYKAIDEGINFFFGFGFDTQLTSALKDVFKTNRDKLILATGAYNLIWWYPNLRRSLEKRLRQFNTDYIDVFMFLGVMKEKEFPERAREEMIRFREEGKVRAIGVSCHDRKFVGKLANEGALDVMMLRYNAAHRGAEQDIFPFLQTYNPRVVSYTATRWRYLLRKPKGYPHGEPIPTASDCYRFVLSNPNVHVCLTAPRNEKELLENLSAMRQGSLNEEEMDFMKKFGDYVHNQKKWFM